MSAALLRKVSRTFEHCGNISRHLIVDTNAADDRTVCAVQELFDAISSNVHAIIVKPIADVVLPLVSASF